MTPRQWFVLIGAVVFFVWLKRTKTTKNELTEHLAEQRQLQGIGIVSNAASSSASKATSLSTLGDSPFAGLFVDPFNSENPFALPKALIFMQPTPQADAVEIEAPAPLPALN